MTQNVRNQYYLLKLKTVNLSKKIDKFIDPFLLWTIIELDRMQFIYTHEIQNSQTQHYFNTNT